MFKTKVTAINLNEQEWDDDQYWNPEERKKSIGKKRMELILVDEYKGDELSDDILRSYGLPEKKGPLEQPVYKSFLECIEYIQRQF